MSEAVHVIGATGRTGVALCRALIARGREVVAVVRDPGKWAATALPGCAVAADARGGPALQVALAEARFVVSTAHGSYAPAILEAAPRARLVLLGSTRRYSCFPDDHGRGVLSGEQALLSSWRDAAMLHPTMIYGGAQDNTVQRLAAMLRRLPLRRVLPLPGGGRNLVQPVHRDDLVLAILAALDRHWETPQALVVAGPDPISYRDFARAVAQAAKLPTPLVIPLPLTPSLALARLAARLPGLPQAGEAEIRRLTEDKAFDVAAMINLLGVIPISLAAGLAREFPRTQNGERRRGVSEPCP